MASFAAHVCQPMLGPRRRKSYIPHNARHGFILSSAPVMDVKLFGQREAPLSPTNAIVYLRAR